MALTLRCRGPSGQSTLTGVDPGMPTEAFVNLLSEKTGVPVSAIEILTGFPPKLVKVTANSTVAVLSLAHGDMLTVRQGASAATAATAAPAQPAADTSRSVGTILMPAAVINSVQTASAAAPPSYMDDDEVLARAIAASLKEKGAGDESGLSSASTPQPLRLACGDGVQGRSVKNGPPGAGLAASDTGQQPLATQPVQQSPPDGPAPQSVPVPGGDGSCVVRRIIDSDNSCLFNSVGYVIERSRSRADDLRKVVADVVAGDPITFNDGFLGKDVQEYCKWIQQRDNWGGAIELFILSQFYGKEIAAYDIQTKRCDIYGQDKGYSERVLLIYDGLHYDALAVAAFEGAPEELDVTMFPPVGPQGVAIMAAAEKLMAATHAARRFTDISNFTLRCAVCQIGLKGEKEAVEHAKATGHSNFAEY